MLGGLPGGGGLGRMALRFAQFGHGFGKRREPHDQPEVTAAVLAGAVLGGR